MRGNAARALLPAIVVLGLVGVVAIAATGSTPSGTGESRPPGDVVLETFLSLGMLLLIPAAVLLVYGLSQRRAIAQEIATGKYKRSRAGGFIALAGALIVIAYFRFRDPRIPGPAEEVDPAFPERELPETPPPEQLPPPRELEFAWIPVLAVLALMALAVGAYALFRRRSAAAQDADDELAEQLAHSLDESLDALLAETDARRAVIAAYARLERVLASQGLPRRDAETANEYVSRVLAQLDVAPASVRDLTDLFTEAKFSSHAVDAAMKADAIAALSTVRDELRARREAERAALTAPAAVEGELGGATS